MLDQPTDETLHRSDQNPMQHRRTMRRVIGPRVLETESLGQVEVELDRRALPLTADGVDQLEVELRPVARPATRVDHIFLTAGFEHVRQSLFRARPPFWSSQELVGASGELDGIRVAK